MAHYRRTRLRTSRAFTLIELLVVIAIIALLLAVLLPGLSAARQRGQATTCLAHLRVLGQGLVMYSTDHHDQLVPGRLPQIDDDNWRCLVLGGWKYRPTFLAMMGTNVGIPPFDDPVANRLLVDRFGQVGNRQDYSSKVYVCTSVPEWTDERNGSYGYNFQFLGNSRLYTSSDPESFKNWPVLVTKVRDTGRCVAVADSMGTAANFASGDRHPYTNNGNDEVAFGNEGFNLDPPRIDIANGEATSGDIRSGADPRHLGRANVLFVDGHVSAETLEGLGYKLSPDGSFDDDGNNARWSLSGRDEPWLRNPPS